MSSSLPASEPSSPGKEEAKRQAGMMTLQSNPNPKINGDRMAPAHGLKECSMLPAAPAFVSEGLFDWVAPWNIAALVEPPNLQVRHFPTRIRMKPAATSSPVWTMQFSDPHCSLWISDRATVGTLGARIPMDFTGAECRKWVPDSFWILFYRPRRRSLVLDQIVDRCTLWD
jgi:hypothetical protein